jgi:hypothetical protein
VLRNSSRVRTRTTRPRTIGIKGKRRGGGELVGPICRRLQCDAGKTFCTSRRKVYIDGEEGCLVQCEREGPMDADLWQID